MSVSLAVALLLLLVVAPSSCAALDVYVDFEAGDDAASGRSADAAVRTLQRALDLGVHEAQAAQLDVHVAAGTSLLERETTLILNGTVARNVTIAGQGPQRTMLAAASTFGGVSGETPLLRVERHSHTPVTLTLRDMTLSASLAQPNGQASIGGVSLLTVEPAQSDERAPFAAIVFNAHFEDAHRAIAIGNVGGGWGGKLHVSVVRVGGASSYVGVRALGAQSVHVRDSVIAARQQALLVVASNASATLTSVEVERSTFGMPPSAPSGERAVGVTLWGAAQLTISGSELRAAWTGVACNGHGAPGASVSVRNTTIETRNDVHGIANDSPAVYASACKVSMTDALLRRADSDFHHTECELVAADDASVAIAKSRLDGYYGVCVIGRNVAPVTVTDTAVLTASYALRCVGSAYGTAVALRNVVTNAFVNDGCDATRS